MIRKVWALPSNPSASPNRDRAIRSRIRSPRWPNGGWPEVVRAGRRLHHHRVAAAELVGQRARPGPDRIAVAIALATAVTLIVWVSRLCTTWPAAPCEITWVTAASREKYGENLIRSRSARKAPSVAASMFSSASGSANRRASRGSMTGNLPGGDRIRAAERRSPDRWPGSHQWVRLC